MKWTKIKTIRRRAAMTQVELAEVSGVSRATIARLEKGAEGPFPGTIQKIAVALEVQPIDLLDPEDVITVGTLPELPDAIRQHREQSFRRGYRDGFAAAIDQVWLLIREDGLSLEQAYNRCFEFARHNGGLLDWQHFIHPTASYLPPQVPREKTKRAGSRQ
jgi:transcriptional regulator with XRE-family HTH domain